MGCIAASLGDVSTPAEIVSMIAEMTSTPAEIVSAPAEMTSTLAEIVSASAEMTFPPAEMTFPPKNTNRPPLKTSPRANFSGGLRVEGLPVDAELSSLCLYLIIYMLFGWLDDVFGPLYMRQAHRP